MAVDPNSTATTTTATAPSSSAATTVTPTTATAATRPLTSPPPSSRPVSPLPHHLHNTHHYPSQPLYTAQPLPIRAPNPHSNPQLSKPHDPSQGILYPVASSGRGFIPKGIRSRPSDQMVTVANHGGYPPHSLVFTHGVRAMGSPHLEYMNHPLHMTRPPNLQYHHIGPAGGSGPIKGVPVAAHTKAAPRSTVSDSNGYKNTRERRREDTLHIVRDRKVRITEDTSLYAVCRSWLRNGAYEESQPQQTDVIKTLPKPLPATMVASFMSNKKEDEEDEEQEEDEKSVEHLSSQDLLNRHIKRAKKVRARLREERLQRIARYRSRLRLLLPPPIEQFRNDTAAEN
ncbi:hypothetical protein L6164_022958 [Bauhinia variegata]|uniref:Uncharacterized protein n=1 Tax=Bauhinia variegata TaxID=167791 RepID=A0ACB9MIN5_BAUVA|nr:hypothetical protein L6164_022958 [Bauhinia variegata]